MHAIHRWSGLLCLLALASCSTQGPPAHGWYVQQVPKTDPPGMPYELWVASDHDAWLGASSIWHFDGVVWKETPPPRAMTVNRFLGFGRFDIWAVGNVLQNQGPTTGIVIHWNGVAWSEVPPPPGVRFAGLGAIAGTSSHDLWIGTDGTLYHYDGTAWTAVPHVDAGNPMWSSTPSDAWLAGAGMCWHYDGTAWVTYQGQPCLHEISPIWGFAADDVWGAGPDGHVIHWDGQSWTQEGPYDPALAGYPSSLWGSGPSDVYVVGKLGHGEHYDGTSWTSIPGTVMSSNFLEIRGSSATNIWAVTQRGGPPGDSIVVMRYAP